MYQFDELTRYFNETGDRNTHCYDFANSPYESPFKRGPRTFGSADYQLHLIDSFSGKRPVLLNYDFLVAQPNRYGLVLRPAILLDSNVANALHRYRCNGLSPSERRAIGDFLLYASSLGVDYNPVFYFLEGMAKSDPARFLEPASAVACSILHFHSMDEKSFSTHREIRPKPDALEHYYEMYGERTLEDCGRVLVEKFIADKRTGDMLNTLRIIYVCLLKMTLLQKTSHAPFRDKLQSFEDFMYGTLDTFVAREYNLAVHYFSNLVGGFLPIQSGMDFVKAKRALWRAAGDVMLLRLPEYLLLPKELPFMNLACVCSADRDLVKLGALATVHSLIKRSDTDTTIGPVLTFDAQALVDRIGQDALDAINCRSRRRMRQTLQLPPRKRVSPSQMKETQGELEAQLANLCRH